MEKRPRRFSLPEAFFEGSRLFLVKAKGVGEEVRGRLSGRREEQSDVAIQRSHRGHNTQKVLLPVSVFYYI
jgi:hypothetical protein